MPMGWALARLGCALLLGALLAAASHAGRGSPSSLRSSAYCDGSPPADAAQQHHALQLAALVREELQQAGARVVLVSRSGLDLEWLGHRYSHAGLGLRDHAMGPWTVRQLYFACDERRPRLFDQGMAAFVSGVDDPERGFLSVVLLGDAAARALEPALRDDRRALAVLGGAYSANAHAFGTVYQNCNQWVAEVLALGWGDLRPESPSPSLRAQAQHWLRERGYVPSSVGPGSGLLMALSRWWPHLHADDHPEEDLRQGRYRVSLPASLEDFVRRHDPAARRLEICHQAGQVVLRRGWEPLGPDCVPGAGDTVRTLE